MSKQSHLGIKTVTECINRLKIPELFSFDPQSMIKSLIFSRRIEKLRPTQIIGLTIGSTDKKEIEYVGCIQTIFHK
jgi:hypothetical protein